MKVDLSKVRAAHYDKVIKLPIKYSRASSHERRLAREQYIDLQDGLCYHCDEPLDGPPAKKYHEDPINWRLFPGGEEGFLKYPVHLHHDHNTDKTIGAVHAFCNAWLFDYRGQ